MDDIFSLVTLADEYDDTGYLTVTCRLCDWLFDASSIEDGGEISLASLVSESNLHLLEGCDND